MNLTHLRAFHSVAAHGSFSRAAQALGVTQPTLSEQVRLLEQRYSVRLLQRSARRVELTRVGRDLFALADRLFSVEAEAETLLASTRSLGAGRLRFGADSPLLATEILKAFHAAHPGVRIQLTTGSAADTRQYVLDRSTEIGISADGSPHPELRIRKIAEHDLVAFVRTSDPLAASKTVGLRELVASTLVIREPGSVTRSAVERALAAEGLVASDVIEVDSREAVHAAVLAGLGVGVVFEDEFTDDPRLVLLDFTEPLDPEGEFLLYRTELESSGLVRAVLACLRAASSR